MKSFLFVIFIFTWTARLFFFLPVLLLLDLLMFPLYTLFSYWSISTVNLLVLFFSSPFLLAHYFFSTYNNFPSSSTSASLCFFTSSFSPSPSFSSLSCSPSFLPPPLPLGVPVEDPLCVQEPDEAQYFPQRLECDAAPYQQVRHQGQSLFSSGHHKCILGSGLLNQVTVSETG